MSIDTIDFNVIADNDFPMSFTVTDSAGLPEDLTGATADLQIRDEATNVVIEATATGGIVNFTGGVIDFALSDIQTRGLLPIAEAAAVYVYDIQLTYADTTKETIVQGNFNVKQGVTRT